MCATCCVLAHHGDGGCAHCASAAAAAIHATEAELPGVTASVWPAVDASAVAFGAPPGATRAAFALASRFHQPQRAATVALYGFARDALVANLVRRGLGRECGVLDSASDRGSYAWLLAAPFGELAVTDPVFACAMRLRFAAPILDPALPVVCVKVSGTKPRSCTLTGCAGGSADGHALSCKCGGFSISSHNYIRARLAALGRSWGVSVQEESHDFLPGPFGMKIDILAHGAGLGRMPLAIDLTRRFAASYGGLVDAEVAKETKYTSRYEVPVEMRGFAFDHLGRLGPQAGQAAYMLVAAGARVGAGHHEDLALELYATFGVALALTNTVRLAHFARLNGDTSRHAPREEAMVPRGQRHATGASFSLIHTGRARTAPFSLVPPPKRRAARAPVAPPPESACPTSPSVSVSTSSASSATTSSVASSAPSGATSPTPSGGGILSSAASVAVESPAPAPIGVGRPAPSCASSSVATASGASAAPPPRGNGAVHTRSAHSADSLPSGRAHSSGAAPAVVVSQWLSSVVRVL